MPVYFVYAAAVGLAYLMISLLIGRSLSESLGAMSGNMVLGYGGLAAANMLLPSLGLMVPINAVTLLCSGLLGMPGAILSAALQMV